MDKTAQQIEAEREAVAAMKNTKANMEKALGRISTLESQLWVVRDFIKIMKGFVPANAFMSKGGSYNGGATQYAKIHDEIDAKVAKCSEVLGHG